MIVHQSDLKSYTRCGELHRRQQNGERGDQLSRTAYGSVMHHALHTLERTRDVELAKRTFEHYWHPLNIDDLCPPVDIWLGKDSWGVMLRRGLVTIEKYWELKAFDEEEVLALEIPFVVPLPGTWDQELGEPHQLAGTIDRLALRYYKRELHVCLDDWKSGKKGTYLKHNLQFTAYALATTQREFWIGNPKHYTEGFGEARGDQLMRRVKHAPRHGWWIEVGGGTPRWNDAGLRGARDYARFNHAVDNYVRAVQHDIYPLSYDGSVCQFCPFRDDCPQGIDSHPLTPEGLTK